MAKLYPPILGGVTPAFYGNEISIPYTMNKTVNFDDVEGFSLIIKSVSTGKQLGVLSTKKKEYFSSSQATFIISQNDNIDLKSGTFYKIQVAYIGKDNVVGYYSSVSTIKCTAAPLIGVNYELSSAGGSKCYGFYSQLGETKAKEFEEKIEEYELLLKNYSSATEENKAEIENEIVAKKEQLINDYGLILDLNNITAPIDKTEKETIKRQLLKTGDKTERVYSYRFDIYDEKNNLFESSGECLHNSLDDDTAGESIDTYTLRKSFQPNVGYSIQYNVITNNNLNLRKTLNNIYDEQTIDSSLNLLVQASLNKEEGYVNITLKKNFNNSLGTVAGSFVLKRASSKDNYGSWELLYKFVLNGALPADWAWKDQTVESGYSYKYALQQYNVHGVYSTKTESDELQVDFEYAFLYDGEKQLKIKYNPKVSSFKITTLETKTDTIGSKFPFFFRNDNVAYREFPISGLISQHSDEEGLFFAQKKTLTTQLDSQNIAAEKMFKMEVLNWLNNGQPKIFRSPTEGNFIVRLMNVSLSPEDALGRMLHSFSATAYEIADYTYQNLIELNFLKVSTLQNYYVVLWEEISIQEKMKNVSKENFVSKDMLGREAVISLDIRDAEPGAVFAITCVNDNTGLEETYQVKIGATREYHIGLKHNITIKRVQLLSFSNVGYVSYAYKGSTTSSFNSIKNITISDWLYKSQIGACENLIEIIEEGYEYFNAYGVKQNTRGVSKKVKSFGELRFFKRPIVGNIYEKKSLSTDWDERNTVFCSDADLKNNINIDQLNPYNLYNFYRKEGGQWKHVGYLDFYQSEYYNIYLDDDKYYWDSKCEFPLLTPHINEETGQTEYKYRTAAELRVDAVFYRVHKKETPTKSFTTYYPRPKFIPLAEYNALISLDGNNIDVAHSNYHKTLALGQNYKTIKIGPGVIAEIFYKIVNVHYDLSNILFDTDLEDINALESDFNSLQDAYEKQASPDLHSSTGYTYLYNKAGGVRLAKMNTLRKSYILSLHKAFEEYSSEAKIYNENS